MVFHWLNLNPHKPEISIIIAPNSKHEPKLCVRGPKMTTKSWQQWYFTMASSTISNIHKSSSKITQVDQNQLLVLRKTKDLEYTYTRTPESAKKKKTKPKPNQNTCKNKSTAQNQSKKGIWPEKNLREGDGDKGKGGREWEAMEGKTNQLAIVGFRWKIEEEERRDREGRWGVVGRRGIDHLPQVRLWRKGVDARIFLDEYFQILYD